MTARIKATVHFDMDEEGWKAMFGKQTTGPDILEAIARARKGGDPTVYIGPDRVEVGNVEVER